MKERLVRVRFLMLFFLILSVCVCKKRKEKKRKHRLVCGVLKTLVVKIVGLAFVVVVVMMMGARPSSSLFIPSGEDWAVAQRDVPLSSWQNS